MKNNFRLFKFENDNVGWNQFNKTHEKPLELDFCICVYNLRQCDLTTFL